MTMEVHREYVGYLDEWDGTERLTDEEIVRCRDCKHCRRDDSRWYCSELMFDIDFVTSNIPPDSFCSWGERRDA